MPVCVQTVRINADRNIAHLAMEVNGPRCGRSVNADRGALSGGELGKLRTLCREFPAVQTTGLALLRAPQSAAHMPLIWRRTEVVAILITPNQ
jgi:hypothetical protein